MNQLYRYFISITLCLLPLNLYAVVEFEVKNKKMDEILWSDGENLHIQSGSEAGYILLKTKERKLFTINNSQKNIIDLSEKIENIPNIPSMKNVSIEIFKHGVGPIMLGYETEFYLLKVNGEICRSEYLSKELSKLSAAVTGLALMTEYRINTTFGDLPEQLDLCFVAEYMTYKRYEEYGFPIKSKDQYGNVDFEIVSIKKDAANPINNFRLPEGYTVIGYEEMINSPGMAPEGKDNEMHPTVLRQDISVPK